MLGGRIIDLSQEIYTGMPVYPGHLKTVIWTHLSHEERQRQLGTDFSYETRGILICDHGPTHIDSVSHLSRDDKTYPCHTVCGERGITHIENLCNLDKLLGKRFTFIALPLKIRAGTGSPVRAVAILGEP